MRSFKQFFNEAAPRSPKPPSVGGGARVTGAGLQIPGVNFSQMGYGYRQPTGPTSLTQYDKQYNLEQRKTELNILVKASKSFQGIFLALNSGDQDEVKEALDLYGQNVYTEGQLRNGAWIRSLTQSDGKGRGLMHRGIAKGYQFSAPEIEFLKLLNVITSAKDQARVPDDVLLDFSGDKIEEIMSERGMGQDWKLWTFNKIDDILGRMASPGVISNQGSNLDMRPH